MSVLGEITRNRDAIVALGAQCGLSDIRVFGSVARGEETSDSDVDVLVNVADASDPLAFVDFQEALSEMLSRKVDLVFERGLYPLLRERILAEAKDL